METLGSANAELGVDLALGQHVDQRHGGDGQWGTGTGRDGGQQGAQQKGHDGELLGKVGTKESPGHLAAAGAVLIELDH